MADFVDWAFWDSYLGQGVILVSQIVAILVPLLLTVAYLTYAERKVIGGIQLRSPSPMR